MVRLWRRSSSRLLPSTYTRRLTSLRVVTFFEFLTRAAVARFIRFHLWRIADKGRVCGRLRWLVIDQRPISHTAEFSIFREIEFGLFYPIIGLVVLINDPVTTLEHAITRVQLAGN